jgi:hypothetical protein
VHDRTKSDIAAARHITHCMMDKGIIPKPPESLVEEALKKAIDRMA